MILTQYLPCYILPVKAAASFFLSFQYAALSAARTPWQPVVIFREPQLPAAGRGRICGWGPWRAGARVGTHGNPDKERCVGGVEEER